MGTHGLGPTDAGRRDLEILRHIAYVLRSPGPALSLVDLYLSGSAWDWRLPLLNCC